MTANGQTPEVDIHAAFEALKYQTGQEISRLLGEVALRDSFINQLRNELTQLRESTTVEE